MSGAVEGGYVAARITIIKTVTDGDVVLTVEREPGDLAVIDGVGMLAMALDTWLRQDEEEAP
jgi:hypothetical protein